MNLRNKANGKLMPIPSSEPEVFVGVDWIREERRERLKGLTADEIVRRAEEKHREDIVARELWQSRVAGLLWGFVGVLIWIGILAYGAKSLAKALQWLR